jgi:hypothetical protein
MAGQIMLLILTRVTFYKIYKFKKKSDQILWLKTKTIEANSPSKAAAETNSDINA